MDSTISASAYRQAPPPNRPPTVEEAVEEGRKEDEERQAKETDDRFVQSARQSDPGPGVGRNIDVNA